MQNSVSIDDAFIQRANAAGTTSLEEDYDHLARQLARRGIDVETLVERAVAFTAAGRPWGVGSGGTRFARFPIAGEPRNIFEKLEDCEVVFKLTRSTPRVSLHIPWDKAANLVDLRAAAEARGLFFDSMNS